jgi:hypothetical protein
MRDPRKRLKWKQPIKNVISKGETTAPDVLYVLMNGQVVLATKDQDVIWEVEGLNLDEKFMRIAVVVFEETITVKIIKSI